MSRQGVTYEDVAGVAEQILRQRENISNEKVRKMLGDTGSFSTIAKYLNRWRNERLPQLIGDNFNEILPPDPVNQAVLGVWEQLRQAQKQELERLKASQLAEINELKDTNYQLNDALNNALKRIDELLRENASLKTEQNKMQETLELEKETRFLAQGALTECKVNLEQQINTIKDLKTEQRLAITELKGAHSEEVANLKEGLGVAKGAMEDYRHRYMVDIDNLKIKNDQLEKQVFDLALARRDAESAKQRLKQDLELSQKELDSLIEEDKLNKNTKSYLEREFKNTRAEITRLNRLMESMHHRQSTEVDGLAVLSKRLLNIEKKFEKVEE